MYIIYNISFLESYVEKKYIYKGLKLYQKKNYCQMVLING